MSEIQRYDVQSLNRFTHPKGNMVMFRDAERDKAAAVATEIERLRGHVSYWQQCHSQTAEAMRIADEANVRMQKELGQSKAEIHQLRDSLREQIQRNDEQAARIAQLLRQLRESQEREENALSMLGFAAESMRLMHSPRSPEYPKHTDHVDGCPICGQIKMMDEMTMPPEEFAKLCRIVKPSARQKGDEQ